MLDTNDTNTRFASLINSLDRGEIMAQRERILAQEQAHATATANYQEELPKALPCYKRYADMIRNLDRHISEPSNFREAIALWVYQNKEELLSIPLSACNEPALKVLGLWMEKKIDQFPLNSKLIGKLIDDVLPRLFTTIYERSREGGSFRNYSDMQNLLQKNNEGFLLRQIDIYNECKINVINATVGVTTLADFVNIVIGIIEEYFKNAGANEAPQTKDVMLAKLGKQNSLYKEPSTHRHFYSSRSFRTDLSSWLIGEDIQQQGLYITETSHGPHFLDYVDELPDQQKRKVRYHDDRKFYDEWHNGGEADLAQQPKIIPVVIARLLPPEYLIKLIEGEGSFVAMPPKPSKDFAPREAHTYVDVSILKTKDNLGIVLASIMGDTLLEYGSASPEADAVEAVSEKFYQSVQEIVKNTRRKIENTTFSFLKKIRATLLRRKVKDVKGHEQIISALSDLIALQVIDATIKPEIEPSSDAELDLAAATVVIRNRCTETIRCFQL